MLILSKRITHVKIPVVPVLNKKKNTGASFIIISGVVKLSMMLLLQY